MTFTQSFRFFIEIVKLQSESLHTSLFSTAGAYNANVFIYHMYECTISKEVHSFKLFFRIKELGEGRIAKKSIRGIHTEHVNQDPTLLNTYF